MNAEQALEDYRKTSDPSILAAVDSFRKLSPLQRQELLYFMICNTNMLLTAGSTITPVQVPEQIAPESTPE